MTRPLPILALLLAIPAMAQTTRPVTPGKLYDATVYREAPKLKRILVANAIWDADTEFGQEMVFGLPPHRAGLKRLCEMAVEQDAEWLVLDCSAGPDKQWLYEAAYDYCRRNAPGAKIAFTEMPAMALDERGGFRITASLENEGRYERVLDRWQWMFDQGIPIAVQFYEMAGGGWTETMWHAEVEHVVKRLRARRAKFIGLVWTCYAGTTEPMTPKKFRRNVDYVRGLGIDVGVWAWKEWTPEYAEALK